MEDVRTTSEDLQTQLREKFPIHIYNSLYKEKQQFVPITPGHVGLYVCGPTVYSNVHIGNCRTFVSFDVIYRYLQFLGYKVRYVRNITDVGHLLDDGEDRMEKRAKSEQLEPMEIAHKYTIGFHEMMQTFNALPPDIEPRATGHILEQIEMVQSIIDNGYGYESNGSVYFDTLKFIEENKDIYGTLSGRKVEDLLTETRTLKGQSEKKNPSDFAIWMKASEGHIMRWNSPWSSGFPGWHLECSAMSTKYLGQQFDIHGGGNDLKFPHHENEIAQNFGACKCQPAKYWIHTNMLQMNGRKMSKSEGNYVTPPEIFSGLKDDGTPSDHLSKGYDPMVVRFFMMQTHYRSTMDLSDDGLGAAEKGYRRLMQSLSILDNLATPNGLEVDPEADQTLESMTNECYRLMSDDFNTARVIAALFELSSQVNAFYHGQLSLNRISPATFQYMKQTMKGFVYEVLGLKAEEGSNTQQVEGLIELLIHIRKEARSRKDFATSDTIRDELKELGVQLKDEKGGETSFSFM